MTSDMATFPNLKTRAVAQYPATKTLRFGSTALRFVDGTEQRYRELAAPLHQWEIRLDLLDEGEIAAIEAFFVENQGRFGSFAFTDPWDETVYPNCSLASDEWSAMSVEEMRGKTSITVVENRAA